MAEMMGTRERLTDIGIGDTAGQRPERLERVDEDVPVLPHALVAAADEQQRLAAHDGPMPLVT